MIDYKKFEIRQVLSSNYGSLDKAEEDRVVKSMENDQAYYMPGRHRVEYVTSFGRKDWARVTLAIKKEYYDSLIPSFEEVMAS